jgi:hypothetical protein
VTAPSVEIPKIYFAGSIRGGRRHQGLYAGLIRHLGRYGAVLTEHVGDPHLLPVGEAHLTDREIYERDIAWLQQADLFIAEVSTPSLGVGYEIARAEARAVPILCLLQEPADSPLSAMVEGHPGLKVATYRDANEAARLIDVFMESLNLAPRTG